ncbi:hypothetical protein DAPPUDRAFT_262374 [Daphnia pulex]|uniref:Uncharacterized protein n=1 Tax=Daphnia pulex TaxID=6669 RepID=E9HMV9_DAPPU|nr:hypothetical protein DAPPUDRAFT_262374 [Daphnia pulex]|eukprot:EFX66937.1 hypothetical protein DAPPUDRAFT_262374 [Daphnia pulex]
MRKNSVDPSQNDSDAGISLEVEYTLFNKFSTQKVYICHETLTSTPINYYQNNFSETQQCTLKTLMLLVVVAVALLYPQDAAVPANSSAAIAVAYGLTADLCVDDRGHNSDRCVRVDTRREMDCETTKTTYASLSNLEKNDESLALNGFH